MSDDEWDTEGFQPKSIPANDQWEGEDEDECVKDDWAAASDSEGDVSKASSTEETKPAKIKPKKKLEEKIAEREALKEQQHAARAPLTEEEQLAEKLRLQQVEENANIQLARDMCGLKENKIDNLVPVTKEDFDSFGKAVSEKVQRFSTSEHYEDMVENVVKEICVDLNTTTLRKLKLHIEGLHSAKLKEEKAAKSKKNKKGSTMKMDLEKDIYDTGDYGDDMDDFM